MRDRTKFEDAKDSTVHAIFSDSETTIVLYEKRGKFFVQHSVDGEITPWDRWDNMTLARLDFDLRVARHQVERRLKLKMEERNALGS